MSSPFGDPPDEFAGDPPMEFGSSEFEDGPTATPPPRDLYGMALTAVGVLAAVGLVGLFLFEEELGLERRGSRGAVKLLGAVLVFCLVKGVKRVFARRRAQA